MPIALEKCDKECNMIKIILVQGFCPRNFRITQFTNGFCLLASFAGNSYCNGYTDRHFRFSPHSPTCSLKEHSEVRLQNSPYFSVFKFARAVKQKVWTRALRAEDSYATLYRFLYWFWEKTRLFCSLRWSLRRRIIRHGVRAGERAIRFALNIA